jgi:peroxiredoxin
MKGKKIVVWFSCGAASAIAAKITLDKFGLENDVVIVNNPVIEEDRDNIRFLRDVEKWLGVKIEFAVNKKHPQCSAVEVWDKRKYMSGIAGAPCTLELKKEARVQWEKINVPDFHVLGFTHDEKKRHERFIMTERENVIPVLIDEKITKKECFEILMKAGVRLPQAYLRGLPNANCIGCVKSSSPTYWNLIRKEYSEIFKHRETQSKKIGCKLVEYKGKRIFLEDLPPDAKGGKLKGAVECGIFCEEKDAPT